MASAVPTPRRTQNAFGEYGIQKAKIEAYLLNEARRGNFPATCLHPGHIVGPGWNPLNPAGHFNPQVFSTLARGDELALPNFGMETVHHVHADDVAQSFTQALAHRSMAVGELSRRLARRGGAAVGTSRRWSAGSTGSNLRYVPWRRGAPP
jgi:nucleoside-diphosphate-sugar epimerase